MEEAPRVQGKERHSGPSATYYSGRLIASLDTDLQTTTRLRYGTLWFENVMMKVNVMLSCITNQRRIFRSFTNCCKTLKASREPVQYSMSPAQIASQRVAYSRTPSDCQT
jgi:hypothetical protein